MSHADDVLEAYEHDKRNRRMSPTIDHPSYELKNSPTGRELVPATVVPMRALRRRQARNRLIREAAAAVLVASLVVASCTATLHSTSTTSTTTTTYSQDCRLGPQDCGYADNGRNGDH